MQLSAGLHGDTFLLQVQLSMFPCCVTDVHQLWSRHPLASCKQTGRRDIGEVDLPAQGKIQGAHLCEQQLFLGVFAETQSCCQPAMHSSLEGGNALCPAQCCSALWLGH